LSAARRRVGAARPLAGPGAAERCPADQDRNRSETRRRRPAERHLSQGHRGVVLSRSPRKWRPPSHAASGLARDRRTTPLPLLRPVDRPASAQPKPTPAPPPLLLRILIAPPIHTIPRHHTHLPPNNAATTGGPPRKHQPRRSIPERSHQPPPSSPPPRRPSSSTQPPRTPTSIVRHRSAHAMGRTAHLDGAISTSDLRRGAGIRGPASTSRLGEACLSLAGGSTRAAVGGASQLRPSVQWMRRAGERGRASAAAP
jgi:hypothetical protein